MSSKNHSALASLTATYTDSENEDERDSDGDDHDSEDSKESQVGAHITNYSSKPKTKTEIFVYHLDRWSSHQGHRRQ